MTRKKLFVTQSFENIMYKRIRKNIYLILKQNTVTREEGTIRRHSEMEKLKYNIKVKDQATYTIT